MFKYYLYKTLREKSTLFWSLVFPLALMTAMNFAFGSIYDIENKIDPHKAVIVNDGQGDFADSFVALIEQFSGEDAEKEYYILSEADTLEEAKKILTDKEAEVVYHVTDDDIEIFLSEDHSDTAYILSSMFADSYKHRYSLVKDALMKDPSKVQDIIGMITEPSTYTKRADNIFDGESNPYSWYFYSTFVMGVFFMSMMGIGLVGDLKADVSKEAMRFSVSPVKKGKMIFLSFFSKFIPCIVIAAIQLIIMRTAFNVSLGDNMIKLAVFVISIITFSLSFGVICGVFFKGTVTQRGNKATGVIMTSVFLSGEMIAQLPGVIEQYCPLINDINPATVMNMAFFKMTVGNSDQEFFLNMAKIIAVSIILMVIGAVILRREKYASV